MHPALEGWSEFNVAVAGAGAALGGLLIVAISVNIKAITDSPRLAARAGAAIAALILGVVAVSLALIPAQPLWVLGLEILLGSAVAIWLAIRAAVTVVRDASAGEFKRFDALNIVMFALPLAGYTVGGVLLLFLVAGGFYAIAFATLFALVGAVVFSWVALVEILR
jgi:hypothetical protein